CRPAPGRRGLLRMLLAASLPLAGTLGPRGLALAGGAAPFLVPPPARDIPAGDSRRGRAILAGGCFWGVQGGYERGEGVVSGGSGSSVGTAASARYAHGGSAPTRHAESVDLTFDPARVSFGTLPRIFFSVLHDPTQVDRQGPDIGPQYRSAISP